MSAETGTDMTAASVRAVETVGNVLTDLVEVAEHLPVRPDRAASTARILERLSEELIEAAELLRQAAR